MEKGVRNFLKSFKKFQAYLTTEEKISMMVGTISLTMHEIADDKINLNQSVLHKNIGYQDFNISKYIRNNLYTENRCTKF